MNIIYYHPLFNAQEWLAGIKQRLPQAEIREWQRGDERPADYALVWRPPHEMLANRRDLKAVFALGAGVDAILDQERKHPGTLPAGVPLLRLEDTGMAQQMQEYALSYVLRYFRRFDEYQALQQRQEWQPLDPHSLDDFTIGILGAGVLGQSVARKLTEFGFSVRCWSRSAKQIDGVQSFAGEAQRAAFLDGVKLVINLLPNTPETVGILNRELFAQLSTGAYLINIARGAHLVEADLLTALDQGQLAAATLDVFAREPLPQDHPFWR
ncbi:TPA: glyoxylate/hydroxypyruvate reductase GhrA, partial [Serratia marcescens]|nr:glyoxylate/hydroxypyruvate reductase GhrA [Serratia marcescens]